MEFKISSRQILIKGEVNLLSNAAKEIKSGIDHMSKNELIHFLFIGSKNYNNYIETYTTKKAVN